MCRYQEETGLEEHVYRYMLELGIPIQQDGCQIMKTAILHTIYNMMMAANITKLLYPTLSKEYGISIKRVERSLRSVVEVSWKYGDCVRMKEIFGYTSEDGAGRPTNSEYIAGVADAIRQRSLL